MDTPGTVCFGMDASATAVATITRNLSPRLEGVMAQSGSVFHLFHSAGVGGVEVHVLQLAAAQREQGWTPRIVARPDSWLAKQAVTDRFEVLPLRMRGFFDPLSLVRLMWLIRRYRPDLLHAHAMRSSHYARLARCRRRPPALVMTAHSTTSWKHFDRSAPVVCVSHAVEAALRARGLSKLHVIHNGIPEIPPIPLRSTDESTLYRQIAERKCAQGRSAASPSSCATPRMDFCFPLGTVPRL